MSKHKVLIIKTGYSEFLEDGNSTKVSYGDVLRVTPLLHYYRDDEVTWLTDESALPLLEGNLFIHRLLPLNFHTAMQLQREQFDTIVNLEKDHDICELSSSIEAWKRFGFRLDKKTGTVQAYDRAYDVLAVTTSPDMKKKNEKTVQELLFELVGAKWNGEEYVLGYKPKTTETFDVGLNTYIGAKWPTKAWPNNFWDELEKKLNEEGYRVTRQDKQNKSMLTNLHSYIDWVNSSKVLISLDSLGLHVAMALKKKVIGLFGPTPHKEVYFYGRGKAILSEVMPECLPCFEPFCRRGKHCMEEISPETVYKEAKKFLLK